MSTFDSYAVTNSAGDAIAYGLSLAWSIAPQTGQLSTPPTLETYNGMWAIRHTVTFAGDTYITHIVAQSEEPGELASTERALATPGVNSTLVRLVSDPTLFLDFATYWKTDYLQYKREVIEATMHGSATQVSIVENDANAGALIAITAAMSVETDTGSWISQDAARLVKIGFVGSTPMLFADAPALNVSPPMQAAAGLEQLVDAVNAITDQDFEISINQGAYVFSIKAKVGA